MTDIFKECLSDIANMHRETALATKVPSNHDMAVLTSALNRRILRLEADLLECLEYFKDRYDVVDGDYGEPSPNREMQLGTMLDQTLNAEAF